MLGGAFDKFLELSLGKCTYFHCLYVTILEQDQGWNSADVVLHWCFAVGVDVELANFKLAFQVVGQLIEDWSNHFAGAAPFSPKVDEHWAIGFQYGRLKFVIGEVRYFIAHSRLQFLI